MSKLLDMLKDLNVEIEMREDCYKCGFLYSQIKPGNQHKCPGEQVPVIFSMDCDTKEQIEKKAHEFADEMIRHYKLTQEVTQIKCDLCTEPCNTEWCCMKDEK